MALQSSLVAPDTILRLENVSSEITATAETISNNPFAFSMPLNVLLFVTILFLVGFFFIFNRRFFGDNWPSRYPSPPARGLLRRNQKRGGVDSSTVKALPTVPYRGGENQLITDCSICLSEFEEGEAVKLIPHCRHVFHSPCLDTWLSSHVSCPMCRGTQFFNHDRDVEVRLDVVEEGGDGGRSTVVDGCDDTWRGEMMMRRSGSSTNLGDRPVVLHRSFSF